MDYSAGARSVNCCRARTSRWWTVALLVMAGACSSATDVQNVTRIAVTPADANLRVRNQLNLQAALIDASGRSLSGPSIYWSTEDSAVAVVSSSGLVTAMAPGIARIAASAEGVSGTATINVPVEEVASVTVVPDTLRLTMGGASRLLATAYDGGGNILNGLTVTWGSSNSAVATVDQTGAVTAVSGGTSTVSASIGGKIGSAAVIVSVPQVASVTIAPATVTLTVGTSSQLKATARDAHGNVINGLPVTWTSGNKAVVRVDTNGLVTGVGKGKTTVAATIGGKAGSATAIVSSQPR